MAVIVVADDSAEIRQLYASCLRLRGHEVHEAADGLDAISAVRQRRPDLLLLDVWMPNCNGFEVLESLRNDEAAARLKVVMLSILGDGETRLEAFGGGAVEYLTKGIGLEELADRIDSVLARPMVVGGMDDESAGRASGDS